VELFEVIRREYAAGETIQGKRLTNAPVRSGQCVMDSFHGRRVWSCGSSTWPPGDSASGCSVPEEWNGAKRVLSQSRNGFEHAGAASGEAGW
jgi:hypothetical protein